MLQSNAAPGQVTTYRYARRGLSENELIVASLIGEARSRVRTPSTKLTTKRRTFLENEVLGVQGELVVAKFLNVWPDLLTIPPMMFKPDCHWRGHKVEVKTTDLPVASVQLRVSGKRKLEDADVYILVTKEESVVFEPSKEPTFILVGWCWAYEIIDESRLFVPADPGQTPNYIMDSNQLRPMGSIWTDVTEV